MVKHWHNMHVSTKWGLAIIGFFLIATSLIIATIDKSQILKSDAMYQNEGSNQSKCNNSCQSNKVRSCGKCVAYETSRKIQRLPENIPFTTTRITLNVQYCSDGTSCVLSSNEPDFDRAKDSDSCYYNGRTPCLKIGNKRCKSNEQFACNSNYLGPFRCVAYTASQCK